MQVYEDVFKSSFKEMVSGVSIVSTHSLRSGGASAGWANTRVCDRLFQRHGRWWSHGFSQEWLC